MQTEKKELIKKFKVVIEDLLDHYEEYTEEEKAQIKDIFQKTAELNAILDKYTHIVERLKLVVVLNTTIKHLFDIPPRGHHLVFQLIQFHSIHII